MDSPTTLIFIGNGFDVAAGYPTSYKDFYESDYFKKILNNTSNINQLAKYIDVYNNSIHGWADLEKILYEYAKSGVNDTDQAFNDFIDIKKALKRYLSSIQEQERLNDELSELVDTWLKEDPSTKFFSYNYSKFLGPYVRQRNPSSRDGRYDVTQPHGYLWDDIVLGIDESQEVNDELSFLYKSYDDKYNNSNIISHIENAKRIIIFGCAMGDSDYWYFKQIFQNYENKFFEIYTKDEKSKQNIFNRIHQITQKSIADIKSKATINIFKTENWPKLLSLREQYLNNQKPFFTGLQLANNHAQIS